MQANDYQTLARKTLITDNQRDTLGMCALGISGEAGEINDILKKHLYHKKNKPLDADKIISEAGDLMWYIAVLAYELNIPMPELMPVVNFSNDSHTSLAFIGFGLAEIAGDIAWFTRMYYVSDSSLTETSRLQQVRLLQKLVLDVTFLAAHIGVPLDIIMGRNIAKLQARHSSGATTANGGTFNPHYQSDSVS